MLAISLLTARLVALIVTYSLHKLIMIGRVILSEVVTVIGQVQVLQAAFTPSKTQE